MDDEVPRVAKIAVIAKLLLLEIIDETNQELNQ
jgi:hypothetical protein